MFHASYTTVYSHVVVIQDNQKVIRSCRGIVQPFESQPSTHGTGTTPSNWRCEETLDSFLKKNNTIGIEGIDTRHLTRIIRESGVMNGAILTTFDPADPANKAETEALLAEIRAYAVTDAVKNVTCAAPEVFNPEGETHIVLMHYGCKRNIVRCLVKRGCKVTVMPAFATAEQIKTLAPDGIMLSNGPGDPAEPGLERALSGKM